MKLKRFLAGLLAAGMLFSTMPTAAFAEGEIVAPEAVSTVQSAEPAPEADPSIPAEAPAPSEVTQAPASSEVTQAPASSEVAQAPASSEATQAPASPEAPESIVAPSDAAQPPSLEPEAPMLYSVAEQGASGITFDKILNDSVVSEGSLPEGNYYLNNNLELTNYLMIMGEVNINLNGFTITGADGVNIFNVDMRGTLNLYDESSATTGSLTHAQGASGQAVEISEGSFNMHGGIITGNSGQNGGGVYVSATGSFTMTGGLITGNTATDNGGGVCVDSGSFVMTGGSITENAAPYGGGVDIAKDSIFTMTGGLITKNNSGSNGGGVYIYSDNVTLGGNANITGNKNGINKEDNNLALGFGKIIKISTVTVPAEGMLVGVSKFSTTGAFTDASATDCAKYFTSDSAAHHIEEASGVLSIATGAPTVAHTHDGVTFDTVLTQDLANAAVKGKSLAAGNYYLADNLTLTGTLTINSGNVNLCLNGKTITSASSKDIFDVSGTFNVYDETANAGSLTHATGSTSSAVYVDNFGTFNMHGGSITGNTAINGGGVYVDGIFAMTGGSIAGNTVNDGSGGGVYVNIVGSFTMTGGSITGNKAKSGGGVYAGDKFAMTGGSITGNTAIVDEYSSGGGGVCVSGNNVTIGGTASIKDNKYGIGEQAVTQNLYIVGTNKIKIGADTNAPTTGMSVGVSMQTIGAFTDAQTDDYSKYFTSDDAGYEVKADAASKALSLVKKAASEHTHDGITFNEVLTQTSGNLAAGNYYLTDNLTLTGTLIIPTDTTVNICLNGKTITGFDGANIFTVNKSGTLDLYDDSAAKGSLTHELMDTGAAVTVSGEFNMHGGSITGNDADANGGGVYVYGGSFNMTGGSITGNTATNNGGGVYLGGGSFTMIGGSITGNISANSNGGGVYVAGGSFIMTDGSITRNTASTNSGGVSVVGSGSFTMTGGSITGNTANNYAGILVSNNNVTLGGKANITDNTTSVNKTASNLNLVSSRKIKISTDTVPAMGMLVGISMAKSGAFTGAQSDDYSAYFTSDNAAYKVENGTGNVLSLVSAVVVKKAPTVADFTFTAPADLTFTNTDKAATVAVASGITGMGAITVKYYDANGNVVTPNAVGTYTVKIDVAEGTAYTAANDLEVGNFEIKYLTTDAVATLSGTQSNGWYTGDVTVTPPDGYLIGISQDDFADTYTITTDINRDFTYYLKEKTTGNITDAKNIFVKRDTTAPEVDAKAVNVSTTSATITVTASDDMSGLDTLCSLYYGDKRVAVTLLNDGACTFDRTGLTANTAHQFTVKVNDNAGNLTDAPVEVKTLEKITDITSVDVTITAPVKGEVPAKTATVPADAKYSVKSVGWVGNPEKFGASQRYTANITLAPLSGYAFTKDTYIITDFGWNKSLNDDGTLTFTLYFPQTADREPTGITISTAPTKKVYTYGDKFDPTGLVLTVSYDDGNSVYVGYASYPTYFSFSSDTSFPAGTEKVTVTYQEDIGNEFTVNIDGISVAKKEVAAPTITGATYNGQTQKPTLADTAEYTVTTNEGGKDAGDYDVVLTLKDPANYKWSDSDAAAKTLKFTIAKAPLTITANAKAITYGDAPTHGDVAYSGFVNNEKADVLTGTLAYTYSYTQYGNIGTAYTITPSGLTSTNYEITFDTGILTVNALEATLTWSGTADRTYDGKASNVTATVSNVKNSDNITVTVTGGTEKDAGTHTATAALSGTKAANYTLPSKATVDYKITPKPLTATITAANKTYDGKKDATVTATVATGITGETLTITGLTGTFADGNVGTGKAVTVVSTGASVAGDTKDNYTINYAETTKANITRRDVSVTADAQKITYGGTEPKLTYTATGLVSGETLTGELVRDIGTDAGTYEIKVGTLTNEKNPNYNITYTGAKLTIDKAAQTALAITGEPVTVTYGDAAFKLGTTGGSGEGAVTWSATGAVSVDANGKVTVEKAGDFTVTATKAADKNHTASVFAIYSGKVKKAALKVTAKPHTITYGDAPTGSGVDYDGFVNKDTAAKAVTGTVGYSSTYTQFGNVGKYTITPNGLTSENYELTYVAGELTVNKLTATLAWNNTATRAYDGTASNVTATVSNAVNGDTVTVTVTGGTETNVGTHTATATVLSNGNYELKDGTKQEYTIVKSATDITKITADKTEYTYGDTIKVTAQINATGAAPKAGVMAVLRALFAAPSANQVALYKGTTQISDAVAVGADGSVTLTYDTSKKDLTVGANTLTLKYIGNAKMADATNTLNVTIKAKAVTAEVTTTGTITKVYDATTTATAPLGVKKTDLVNTTDVVTVKATATYADANAATGKAIGFTNVKAEGADKDYYTVSAPTTVKDDITPKEVGLTWDNFASRTYDGKASAVTATATGVLTGDTVSVTVANGTQKYGGTHKATATALTGASAANYKLPSAVTQSYTITPMAINATVTAIDKPYDGTDTASVSATATGAEGDTIAITGLTGKFAQKNVGNSIKVTVDSSKAAIGATLQSSYTVTYNSTTNASITRRAVAVKAKPQSKNYNAADPATFDYDVENIVKGETLKGKLTRDAGEDVKAGGYAITQGTVTNANNPNYDITYVGAVFTINPIAQAEFKITDKPTGKFTYGNAAFTLKTTGGSGTGAVTWKVDSGNATVENGKVTVKGAGEIKVTATKAADVNSSAPVSDTFTFTVDKAPLIITANDNAITYGDAFAHKDVAYAGFVNSEDAKVLGGKLAYDTTYTMSSDVGKYDITPKGLTSDNYEITFKAGVLTVGVREVTLTWQNTATRAYDAKESTVTATAGSLVNNDAITVTVTGGTEKNVGKHTATATALEGSKKANYKLPTAVNQEYTIVQSATDITEITADKDAYTYGDTITVTAKINASGKEANGLVKLLRSVFGAPSTNQVALYYGETQISEAVTVVDNTATLTYDTSKQLVPTQTNTLTLKYVGNSDMADASNTIEIIINRKPVTVTANDLEKTFGAKDPEFTYVAEGLLDGESLVGTLLRENGEDVKDGGYAITQGTLTNANNPNYAITFTNGTLTITKTAQGEFKIVPHTEPVTYGDAPFTLATTGGSGKGDVKWTATGAGTVDENGKITVTGAGEIVITATKAADVNHAEPVTASYTITVAKKALTWDLSELNVTTKKHYNGDTTAAYTGSLKVAGAVSGDDVGFGYTSLSVNYTDAAAGKHAITVLPVGLTLTNGNYLQPTTAITYEGEIVPVQEVPGQPNLPEIDGKKTRIVLEVGLSLTPDSLVNTQFNTPAIITGELLRVLTQNAAIQTTAP